MLRTSIQIGLVGFIALALLGTTYSTELHRETVRQKQHIYQVDSDGTVKRNRKSYVIENGKITELDPDGSPRYNRKDSYEGSKERSTDSYRSNRSRDRGLRH